MSHILAPLSLKSTTLTPLRLPDAATLRDGWEALLKMAALARAVNPSLPATLRAFKRIELGDAQENVCDMRLVFTNTSTAASGRAVLNDASARDFWSCLEETLGKSWTEHARTVLEAIPRPAGTRFEDALFSTQERFTQSLAVAGRHVLPLNDDEHGVVSYVVLPQKDWVTNDASFYQLLLEIPPGPHARVDSLDPTGAGRVRLHYQEVDRLTSTPYAVNTPLSEKDLSYLRKHLAFIKAGCADPTFNDPGTAGFLIATGRTSWLGPLLDAGACLPSTPYKGVLPAVWALAHNDPDALNTVLNSRSSTGGIANALLPELPAVFATSSKESMQVQGVWQGTTSLLGLAVMLKKPELVQVILDAGANPNYHDATHGTLPLHLAAQMGDSACVTMLLRAGADPTACNDYDQTPQNLIPVGREYDALFGMLQEAANTQKEHTLSSILPRSIFGIPAPRDGDEMNVIEVEQEENENGCGGRRKMGAR